MEKKKQRKQYIEYKSSKKGIAVLAILFVVVMLVGYLYMGHLKDLIYKNIYKNIEEFSEQIATQLSVSIKEQKKVINLMTEYVNKGHIKTIDAFFDVFRDRIKDYHFSRIAILDKNGNGKTIDGYDVNNYHGVDEFFENGKDEVYLTENRPSMVAKDIQVNIYSKTFMLDGEEMVLMATVYTSDYQKLLVRRLFGKGGSYLITNDGTVLIDSFDNIKDSTQNLYEYFKTKYCLTNEKEIKKIDDLKYAILSGEEGTFDINSSESASNDGKRETYFIHYEKLDINDWYVVTTASDNTIAYEFLSLEIAFIVFYCGFSFLILSIALYIIVVNQKKNRKIYDFAYMDPVTGLGNENFFRGNGIVYLQENASQNGYILTMDINKFKALNSLYGYEFCNTILKTLGQKLKSILPQDNITCRISNDVFASIFSFEEDVQKLLEKVSEEVSLLKIEDTNLHVHVSIGVYRIAPFEEDINKILDKSYLARAQVKGVYNNNYYLFDERLEKSLLEAQELESGMKHGLEAGEFMVYYQPKVLAKNGKTYGAEALVRWNRNGELIPPNKFIPLFEKNKFITKLDVYIFEKVCMDIAEWKERYGKAPIISINVSKEDFADENFIDQYIAICNQYHIEPSSIDLEITESATIDKDINIMAIMKKIKEKGFIISLDDFGTGYSSLSMLQNMPIDIIKIDRVFIVNANLHKDNNIINYIILMAKQLGARTVIEGVETQEQVDFVNHIQGDIIQGYYFSKPLPKDEFEDYFKKN